MKLNIDQSETKTSDPSGPQYWRSLDELTGKPEFKEWLHREFPQGASEAEGVNRRHFMKIMAASFAAAGVGAAGCRRPEANILPYGKQPEGTIPGLPVFFSSSFPDAKDSLPLVVETHQHRPTHLEGNPQFGPNGSALSAVASASVLNLYDPDRMTGSAAGTRRITRERVKDVLASVPAKYAATGGQGLALLLEPSSSPTRARLLRAFQQKYPRAVVAEYSAVDRDNPERAARDLFGRPLRPQYLPGNARRVLALDADFTSSEPGSIAMSRSFAKTRKVRNQEDAEKMSRLYAVESNFTLTGGFADHRLRLSSSQIPAFTALLTAAVLDQLGQSADLAASLRNQAGSLPIDASWIQECARDLVEFKGASLVIPGSHLPLEAQYLAIFLNDILSAGGNTLRYLEIPANPAVALTELANAIRAKRIEILVIMGGNPVYNAPANLGWKELQKAVPEVIRYGYYYDETSLEAGLNIAATHYLESWSDGRSLDGTYLPVQPVIYPLFDGFQELEVLARLSGLPTLDTYALVLQTFKEEIVPNAQDRDFQRLLSGGFLPESGYAVRSSNLNVTTLRERIARIRMDGPASSRQSLELRIEPHYGVGDGFYNNNGWLQEMPDPMTKLTWDNAILVSPALALELGFDPKSGEFLIKGVAKKNAVFKRGREIAPVAKLTIDGVSITGPIHIQPGLADWTVVVTLGYGRTRVGRVGTGTGYNAYPLTHTAGNVRQGATIELTGEEFRLGNTQEHWSMEGRAIIREANLDQHKENSGWAQEMGMESHSPPVYGAAKKMPLAEKSLTTPRGGSAYETPDFGAPPPNVDVWQDPEAREKFIPPQQWGMSIDLNTCIGCTSCIIACQSENNIPIVGKDQIMRGREMHWIRLDRYYSSGDLQANQTSLPHDPQTSVMPVGCLHCEMAPCEQVCPVNATVHDKQGLNVMAYNRCVGTRYCANNCPYKVRRFNFFDYNKRSSDDYYKGPLGEDKSKTDGGVLVSMQKNPDVTVRMRGVMEKCTYCVQRIEQGKIAQLVKAKDSNDVHVPDGLIRTACQAACPTESIVFGDISDPDSAVSRAKDNDRDYALLGYLNTRPRTTYLARLRNPNKKMPDYAKMPLSSLEYKSASGGGH